MASPLSPLGSSQLNSRTPVTATRNDKMSAISQAGTPCKAPTPTKQTEDEVIDWDEGASSPFVDDAANSRAASNNFDQPQVDDTEIDAIFEDPSEIQIPDTDVLTFSSAGDKENVDAPASPSRQSLSVFGTADGTDRAPTSPDAVATPEPPKKAASPMKAKSTIKKRRSSTFEEDTVNTRKTLRFHSPIKTSPVRQLQQASETPLPASREASFEKAEDSIDESFMTAAAVDETNIDDTCFSTFSAVPDMTLFAKLGESRRNSPAKRSLQQTPHTVDQTTPRPLPRRHSPSRSPSPTPRRPRTPGTAQSNSTYLIDFTQQIEHFADASNRPSQINQTPSRRSPQKSSTEPDLLSYLNKQRSPQKGPRMSTPAKSTSLLNLLDFELPPAPTPRSIPTITIRELESMKSSYQSQISSLKATLSGREAEVESLKKAVGDAERRVGEALESLREEKGQREQIEHEKNEWEKRGLEFEKLLKNVREEVLRSDEEKEALVSQAEESERNADRHQRRADEAESKILDLEAQLATARAAIPKGDGSGSTIDEAQIHSLVQQQLDAKVEAVSRELHAVYKKKHETKVSTLKKSYEARSEKKCAEMQARLDDLIKQNDELSSNANSNIESSMLFSSEDRKQIDEAKSTIEEQRAQLAGLTKELNVMRNEQADLVRELEKERVEKGELVAAVDEMLSLQSGEAPSAAVEDFRRSISRPAPPPHSNLPSSFRQPPVAAESKIGRGKGVPRPSGIASKSKMMSNIERMGGSSKH